MEKKKNYELPLEQNTRQSVDSSGYTETTQGTHQSNKSSGKNTGYCKCQVLMATIIYIVHVYILYISNVHVPM